jgi:hypothetical protein
MFLSTQQNKSKNIQTENIPKTSTSENSPKKESPRELDQKYAGGGYSKSPNPKSLGKPKFQSKSNPSSPTKEQPSQSQSMPSIKQSVSYDPHTFFSKIAALNQPQNNQI